jgi:hypothetical protein
MPTNQVVGIFFWRAFLLAPMEDRRLQELHPTQEIQTAGRPVSVIVN